MRRRWSWWGMYLVSSDDQARPCTLPSFIISPVSVRYLWELDKYRYEGSVTRPEMRKLCWTEQYAMEMEAWYAVTWNVWHFIKVPLLFRSQPCDEGTRGGNWGLWWGLWWGLDWGCLVSVKCKQGGETERERPRWGRKLIRCSNITRTVSEVSRYIFS